jgi:hypothetical protein
MVKHHMFRAINTSFRYGIGVLIVAALATPLPCSQSGDARSAVTAAAGQPPPGLFVTVQPLSFEANRGQTDHRVRFLLRGNDYTLFLTTDKAVFALRGPSARNFAARDALPDKPGLAAVLSLQLLGANPAAIIRGEDVLMGKRHYFIGSDPAHWHTDVPTYAKVRYKDVYQSIDLVYYGNAGLLEYDFIVRPGADPHVIQLAFGGAISRLTRTGDMILHTAAGDIVQRAPRVYQDTPGGRRQIKARYVLLDRDTPPHPVAQNKAGTDQNVPAVNAERVAFEIGDYDTTRPLIIDPALSYASFLGGSSVDEGNAVAVDGTGNFYVTGGTMSTDIPGDNGTFSPHVGGVSTPPTQVLNSPTDAFVSKYDTAGTLLFSVYLGGDGVLGDAGNGIAVDGSGKIYVTGYSSASLLAAYPTTASAYKRTGTGNFDVFVTVLTGNGDGLVYSTLIGGGKGDIGEGIALDAAGNVYVAGKTTVDNTSFNFPTTSGAYQTTSTDTSSSFSDAFVLKIDPTKSGAASLIYSTLLGGSSVDEATAVTVDGAGNAYVTGQTLSNDFPTTSSAMQPALGGGYDAIVSEVNPGGDGLMFSTYLGGGGTEDGTGIALDGLGNVYVTGETGSGDFPISPGAYSATLRGQTDAFITKFDTSWVRLYSSYLGGGANEDARSVAVDTFSKVYLTGWTDSGDFPQHGVTIQSGNAGGKDAFIAKLDPLGGGTDDLVYSGYLGGLGDDTANGVAVDGKRNAYITGWTVTDIGFPHTVDAAQTTFGGGARDTFIARVGPFADLGVALIDNNAVLNGILTYSVIVANNGPDPATGIIAVVTLPVTGVTFTGADAGCSHANGIVTCNVPDLAVNGQTTVTINTTITTPDPVVATVNVTANEGDYPATVLNNNTASQTTIATATGDADPNDSDSPPATQNPPPFIQVGTPPLPTTAGGSGGGGAVSVYELALTLIGLGVTARRRTESHRQTGGRHSPS